MIKRGYKLKTVPTEEQAQTFAQWLGCARWTWNWGLEARRTAWKHQERLASVDLGKRLGTLYEERPWLADVPACVLQQTLRDLDKAVSLRGGGARPASPISRQGTTSRAPA